MSYLVVVLVTIAIFAILAVALNIVVGYAGQPNLAQSAFFGLGAYFAAIMATRYGIGFWWTIPIAFGVAGLAGFILGAISLRLREDFLAITTIGLNFVMVALFQYVPFFGGAVGISSIPLPTIGSRQFGNVDFLVVALVMLLLTVAISAYLERSWFGASLVAIRDDEEASASIGIPIASYKVAAFTLSAALAGMAGSVYAPFISAVTPTSFGFTESVVVLSMLIFGGIGKIRGAIVGALILGALPEAFRFISNFRLLTYGAILLLMLRFQPQGLLGDASLASKIVGRMFRGGHKTGTRNGHGPA
ncbi:MAG TPA: branched-chain amino acid ABC transporter permease [Rectinemataceae bacterium]|nr:branched-chain amino acid ABC transporter permease [Rectinemataceae bacterium]